MLLAPGLLGKVPYRLPGTGYLSLIFLFSAFKRDRRIISARNYLSGYLNIQW